MKSKTKKFLLIFSAGGIAILGSVFYFWQFQPETSSPPAVNDGGEPREEYKNPISKIVSPAEEFFQNGNFSVKVWDVDAGGSGIDTNQCVYSVYSCSKSGCELTLLNRERKCNGEFSVRVGEKSDCSFEGEKSCRVVVKAKDLAGNSNIVSGAEESLKDFGVDWTAPEAEITAFLPITARVSDNVELSNCDLIVDGQSQYEAQELDFSESVCLSEAKGKCYTVSSDLILAPEKDHKIKINCWDLAGNMGSSNIVEIKASINHKPEISFCKSFPAQGNLQSEFRFEVRASDSDEDPLSYLWDFGDGFSSEGMDSLHKYGKKGVFEPQVAVSDGKEKVKCSTAWVNVVEE